MPNSFRFLFLSLRRRISRGQWWWASFALGVTFAVLFVFVETTLGRGATLMLYPPFYWGAFALAIKRLHDSGRTGWWLLVLAIPVLGPLWLFYQLGLRAGTVGENQYGDDPLTRGADYLTVKVTA